MFQPRVWPKPTGPKFALFHVELNYSVAGADGGTKTKTFYWKATAEAGTNALSREEEFNTLLEALGIKPSNVSGINLVPVCPILPLSKDEVSIGLATDGVLTIG